MARDLSIEAIKANLSDPLRTYMWELFIPNMPGGGDVEAVRLRCVTAELPNVASEPITVDWRAMRFRIAGKLNFSHTITLSFLESSDIRLLVALYSWRKLIIDPETGAGNSPKDYKTDSYLSLLNMAGTAVLTVKLIGCYPEDVQAVALDMATNEIIKQPLVLSYDRWIYAS